MAQMAFAEHHDMIEAFPADRADQTFCVCVCQGERGDVGRSRIPIDPTRRINISPYAPSRSRIRERWICSQPQASVS
jgi:hypothetical protein